MAVLPSLGWLVLEDVSKTIPDLFRASDVEEILSPGEPFSGLHDS
jgi:hypothetical protein